MRVGSLLLGCVGSERVGFSSCDAQAHGLSCPAAYGIFPNQRLNPWPLHLQEFLTLNHQGSPSLWAFWGLFYKYNIFSI